MYKGCKPLFFCIFLKKHGFLQTENIVKRLLDKKPETAEKKSKFNTDGYNKLEENLRDILGTKVKLKSGKNKGAIEIEYYSDEDLDRIMALMNKIII